MASDDGHLFSSAYTYFSGQLDTFLDARYTSVVDAVRGPLTAALVIYIAIYGYAILRGVVSEPFQDFIYRMAKICLIFVAATTVAYKDWVTNPLFHAAPSAVTQAVSGKDYTSMGDVFDKLEDKAKVVSQRCRDKAQALPVTQLGYEIELYILAFFVDLASEIAAVIGFGVSMMAVVALAVIIALGPIFIALSLFEWGRRFFNGWLGQAFNYIILLAVITTMAALITDLGDTAVTGVSLSSPENQAAFYITYFLLGAFFFFQAPSLASGIAGGASVGAGEFAGSMIGAGLAARSMLRRPTPRPPKQRPPHEFSGGSISA
ncbi:type IV secretion system protein [Sphingomonas vulcanisoli]|nr:type IV secretion system protein [Sphingomonas vulcanisoli]